MASEALRFPFTARGYLHTLLAREGRVCLVERGQGAHYEVVILRARPPARCPSGTLLPAREAYPSTSDWGEYGWSYVQRENAERWYRAVCRRERSRMRRKSPEAPAHPGRGATQVLKP